MHVSGEGRIGMIPGGIVGACAGAFIGSGSGINVFSRKGLDSPLLSWREVAWSGALVGAVVLIPVGFVDMIFGCVIGAIAGELVRKLVRPERRGHESPNKGLHNGLAPALPHFRQPVSPRVSRYKHN